MQKAEGADHAGARSALVSLRNLDTEREHFVRRHHVPQPFVGVAVLLLTCVGIGLAATGCGGGNSSDSTPPSGTSSSRSATAVATETVPYGTPVALSTLPQLVQDTLAAVSTEDDARLLSLMHPRPSPCAAKPRGAIGSVPICPNGVSEGTPAGSYIVTGSCEGGLASAAGAVNNIDKLAAGGALPRFVVRLAGTPQSYLAVFEAETSGLGWYVALDESGIVQVNGGCAAKPQEIASSQPPGSIIYSVAAGASEVAR